MSRHKLWKDLKQVIVDYNKKFPNDKITNKIGFQCSTTVIIKKELERLMEWSAKKEALARKVIRERIAKLEDCSICMDKMSSPRILKCKHRFHQACIRELFFCHLDDRCPLCREEYEYKITGTPKAQRRQKRRLKECILKKLRQHITGRIEPIKVLQLWGFLHERDKDLLMQLPFLTELCEVVESYLKNNEIHFSEMYVVYLDGKATAHCVYLDEDKMMRIIREASYSPREPRYSY